MIILGIDPGLAALGYGAVKTRKGEGKNFKCLGFGCIKTNSDSVTPERLKKINNKLSKIIKKYNPDIIAVETLYFFKNLKTAMPVSQAKGVVLLTAAKNKVPTIEVTPLEVKMAVVGYGRATKKQTQKMVKKLVGIQKTIRPNDAADALGVAICGKLKYCNKKI